MLTQTELKELIHYNPETGVFVWQPRARKWFESDRIWKAWNTRRAFRIAGYNALYQSIRINKKIYPAHRLAWLYVHGYLPEQVDHVKGETRDNRIVALEAADNASNHRNMKRQTRNTSGVTGVYFSNRKWLAQICYRGKRLHLGSFWNPDDAIAARKAAEVRFGFHENHGRVMKGRSGFSRHVR